MAIPFVSASELRDAVPFIDAIDALEHAFLTRDVVAPDRERHATTTGDLLVMPAWGADALGIKLVTVNPDNPGSGRPLIHGVYILFDEHATPVALLDAEELTRIRTAAVSGVATRALARADAAVVVVFGAGVQASGHLESMSSVRPIERAIVVARTEESAERLVANERTSVEARVGSPEDVADADIVCTCTTSGKPVFDGSLVRPGTHVNAVGSYRPDARELDDVLLSRAASVVVEDEKVATAEAGDVIMALASGALERSRVVDLQTVLERSEPRSREDISVFKSVGMAMEDLTVARLAAERLRLL
jgi:ornithine cyclodeaminase